MNEPKSNSEYFCDGCGDLLDAQRDLRYKCPKCPDFDVCKDCYLSEEVSHPHSLIAVKPKLKAKLLFSLEDTKKHSKGTLYLSNYPVALPASPFLKKLDIKGVLSILQLDAKDDTAKLMMLFNGGKMPTASDSNTKKSTLVINKVLYHHIDIPDLQGPDLLHQYNEYLFEEATTFIDECLKHGNVLVHCKEGQKRSPTIFLAWMITRGYSVEEAMTALGEGYQDTDFDWREKYEKTRSGWIGKLQEWGKSWKQDQKEWRRENRARVEHWQRLIEQGVLGDAAAKRRVVASSEGVPKKQKQQQQPQQAQRETTVKATADEPQQNVLGVSLQEKRQALAEKQRAMQKQVPKKATKITQFLARDEEEKEEPKKEEKTPNKKRKRIVLIDDEKEETEDGTGEEETVKEPCKKKERTASGGDAENTQEAKQGEENKENREAPSLENKSLPEPPKEKPLTSSSLIGLEKKPSAGVVDASKPGKVNTLFDYFKKGSNKVK